MKVRVDTFFYHIGKFIWLPVLIAGSWFAQQGFDSYSGYMACSIYQKTGFPCPGCGGTRAMYYLFRGEIGQSFSYHPVIICGVVVYLQFMLLYFMRKHILKNIEQKEIHIEYYIYILAAIIVLQWIVKMIGLFV